MRSCTVQKLDNYGGIAESVDRQSCYLMRVDEMYAEVSNDPSGKPPSTGLFVGCFVDTATGVVSFTCEGKEIKQRFKMEPGTKLFPSVFLKASSKDALQFELGRTQTTLPLSAAIMVNSGKHIVPQFPQRLKVRSGNNGRNPNPDLEKNEKLPTVPFPKSCMIQIFVDPPILRMSAFPHFTYE